MKELSIEEKAKAYDEAIAKGKQIQNTPYTAHWDTMKEVVEHLFPELKESKGEKIRKEIISALKFANHKGVYDKHLAWLEKQGEQKLVLDKESSFVDNDVRLSLELYRDGNGFGIWLSDDFGGSGIDATGNTPEEAANSIAAYIADYFYKVEAE